jgi:signal transduction histidine kinase
MVVQAEACEAVLAVAPERSAGLLHGLQQSGREALSEMQQTVHALRSGESHEAAGLNGLPTLLEATRRAGLPVAIEMEGPDRPVPAEVEECAYSIVREALTNALRHSDRVGAAVRISYETDRLEVSILDRGRPVRRSLPGGHGLMGLRETVAAHHGTITAGPTDHGQYLVRASLPLR